MENRDFFDELEAALTPEVLEGLLKYAAVRCQMMARVGIPVDSDVVEHLAWDAISDTTTGRPRWDPARCSLFWHLRRVIQNRTLWMMRRHCRRPHLSIDAEPGCDAVGEAGLEGEASVAVHDKKLDSEDVAVVRDLVVQVTDKMHEAAKGNEHLELLLMAYEDGVTERGDVIEVTDMSEKEHDNAKKRLTRLTKQLSAPLRTDVRSVIGGRS